MWRTPSAFKTSITARPAFISVTADSPGGAGDGQPEAFRPAVSRFVAQQGSRRAEIVTGHPERPAGDMHDRVAGRALRLDRSREAAPRIPGTQIAVLPVGARRQLNGVRGVARHPTRANHHHAETVGVRIELPGGLSQNPREGIPIAWRRRRGRRDRERALVTAVDL